MYINEHELWLLAAFYLFMLVLVIRIVYEYELIHKKTLSITADRNKYAQKLHELESSIAHLNALRYDRNKND